jgi:alkanesulfonate monooxygenase SsuD/methylene tetrahydromethanopterin reductase-like flavin-dependent oxidoreductase (luciferase family)
MGDRRERTPGYVDAGDLRLGLRWSVPMVRPATPLGPIGLVLPTFVQDTVPPWASTTSRSGPPATGVAAAESPVAHAASICRQAEQMGADALWACDHLFWHGPSLECMVVLAVAATATDRSILGTCVVQRPLRQAPAVAKQAATLQTLSQGRLILGVGVGSHPGEYEEAGVDYRSRGRLLDAGIAELRRSWASGEGVTRGDTEAGGPARYRQLPEPPPVPVWVGGSSEAALRRAATSADGWMPLFLTPGQYGQAVERLAKEVSGAGRDADEVIPSIVLFVSIDDDPATGLHRGTGWMSSLYGIPARAFERHLVTGTAAEVAGVIATYREAGAEHVAVYVTADEPLEQFERLIAAGAATSAPERG